MQFNDYSVMNFLLPLLVGGPDMANKSDLLFSCSFSLIVNSLLYFYSFSSQAYDPVPKSKGKIKLRAYYSTSANVNVNIDHNNIKNLGSYLAGLFEGDGHI